MPAEVLARSARVRSATFCSNEAIGAGELPAGGRSLRGMLLPDSEAVEMAFATILPDMAVQ